MTYTYQQFQAFAAAIRRSESGDDGTPKKHAAAYRRTNRKTGAIGAYQFMRCRLADFGLCERATGADGMPIPGWGNASFVWVEDWSDSRFLADAAAQDEIFERHVRDLCRQLRRLAMDRFIGTAWSALCRARGVEVADGDDFAISLSGMVGAAHLAGVGGVQALLLRGQDRDDGRTTTSDYLRRFAGLF